MMQKKRISWLFGAVLTLLFSQSAYADLVYSIGISAPSTVQLGQNFNATIFLQETVTGGSSTILGDPGVGILQGNFLLNRTAGLTVDITGVTLNPAFDNGGGAGTSAFASNFASGTQFTIGFLSGTETFVGSGVYQLNLGTISMTATSLGSTTFTSADFDPDPLFADLVLGDGTVLDSTISFGAGSIDVIQSAPEPTTMGALGAFGAIGAAVSYYRRRKQKQATPTTTA